MKNKNLIISLMILGIIALLVFGALLYQNHKKYDGSTLESRELLLDKTFNKSGERQWSIATETKINDYIVSGAYSTDNKSSLAVFKPVGNNKYKLITSTKRNNDEIILSSIMINNHFYDLIWFNGAQTEYAEIMYTINGKSQEPVRYNTSEMNIIYTENHEKDYTIHAAFYDKSGNKYE